MSLITKELIDKIESSSSSTKVKLKSGDIKNKLYIFIKSFIENPVLSS